MPVFKPDFNSFKLSFESALKTNSPEIIVVDDNTPKDDFEDYHNFLSGIVDKRVKVIFNHKNKGMFDNAIYGISKASSEYVKKLDCDDELDYVEFNKLNSMKLDQDIIFTQFIWGKKTKNKTSDYKKWIIFNGNTIYKTSIFNALELNKTSKTVFADLIPTFKILSNEKNKIGFISNSHYIYKIVGDTTPKKLLKRSDDWLKGYQWLLNNCDDRGLFTKSWERQHIFYELLSIKLGNDFDKRKYKYHKYFNYLPLWFKKIISSITFTF